MKDKEDFFIPLQPHYERTHQLKYFENGLSSARPIHFFSHLDRFGLSLQVESTNVARF
jgi:hypothetical protein